MEELISITILVKQILKQQRSKDYSIVLRAVVAHFYSSDTSSLYTLPSI